jgi:hypothetical protein
VIPSEATFEGIEEVALELPQDEGGSAFGRDRLEL